MQIKHEWDAVSDGDDRDRVQMADDDANDSQALTGGDITRYIALLHESATCHKPDQTSSSHQCRCARAKPSVRDMERVKRIGRYLARKPRAKCCFRWEQSGELEAYSDADWGGDKATRRSGSAGVIMRGGHCLKVWTKKQQVIRRAWDPERGKGLGISCGRNLHLEASATMCLVSRGLGKAKHVDKQNLWIQEASKSGRFVTKKVGTSVKPADLMTKPLPKPETEQPTILTGYEFMKTGADVLKSRPARTWRAIWMAHKDKAILISGQCCKRCAGISLLWRGTRRSRCCWLQARCSQPN